MTDDPKKPDSNEPSIKQAHRRAAIVRLIMENPSESSCRKLTARLYEEGIETSKATVAKDLKSPDLEKAQRDLLFKFLDMQVIHYAVDNLNHSIVVEGNVADSKWLLDRLSFFPPKELRIGQIDSPGDLTANAIAELIREMFPPEALAALANELGSLDEFRPLLPGDTDEESGGNGEF